MNTPSGSSSQHKQGAKNFVLIATITVHYEYRSLNADTMREVSEMRSIEYDLCSPVINHGLHPQF